MESPMRLPLGPPTPDGAPSARPLACGPTRDSSRDFTECDKLPPIAGIVQSNLTVCTASSRQWNEPRARTIRLEYQENEYGGESVRRLWEEERRKWRKDLRAESFHMQGVRIQRCDFY
jgi:hypothetical protein